MVGRSPKMHAHAWLTVDGFVGQVGLCSILGCGFVQGAHGAHPLKTLGGTKGLAL